MVAGIAVTVGVKSLRVIVVALPALLPFLLGANVGLARDANGRITGVNVLFLDWNVSLDLTRPSESSVLFSSSSGFSVLSSTSLESLIEPSITTGDGEMVADGVTWTLWVAVGEIVGAMMKLDVLSIIWAYLPSITVPRTLL